MDFLKNLIVDVTKSFQEVSLEVLPKSSKPQHNTSSPECAISGGIKNDDDDDNKSIHHEIISKVGEFDGDVDALTAQEITEMSPAERAKVSDALHGVSEIQVEEPKQLLEALLALDQELGKIKKKPAYDVACLQSSSFVNERSFRLMFIRADEYDPKKAAQRMVRYFEEKRTLFGDTKLTKYIAQSDLNPDDMDCLKLGSLQMLASTDRSGRLVGIITPQNRRYKTLDNLARAFWYTLNVAIRNHELSQKTGMVIIGYDATDVEGQKPNLGLVLLYLRLCMSIPFKFSSMHYCLKNDTAHAKLVRMVSGKTGRRKTRVHIGSPLECRHALLTYGIVQESIPLDYNGLLLVDNHLLWIEKHRAKEESQSNHKRDELKPTKNRGRSSINKPEKCASADLPSPYLFLSPDENVENVENTENGGAGEIENKYTEKLGPYDVPFGRGSGNRSQPGYKWFHQLIDRYSVQYEAGSRFDKMMISELIVTLVHEKGGRFMACEGTKWVEADDDNARKKVSHTFRAKRKAAKNNSGNIAAPYG